MTLTSRTFVKAVHLIPLNVIFWIIMHLLLSFLFFSFVTLFYNFQIILISLFSLCVLPTQSHIRGDRLLLCCYVLLAPEHCSISPYFSCCSCKWATILIAVTQNMCSTWLSYACLTYLQLLWKSQKFWKKNFISLKNQK